MVEQQITSTQAYQSFLLRIWQPHPTAGWCFQLKSVSGQQSVTFDSPEELVLFMQTITLPMTHVHLGS